MEVRESLLERIKAIRKGEEEVRRIFTANKQIQIQIQIQIHTQRCHHVIIADLTATSPLEDMYRESFRLISTALTNDQSKPFYTKY